ncbi:hypothetical protein Acr_29g0011220 [Actinidia rufa]|uniref:Uncharacterized protein n=1 Tax=Actinidia rufa TaxID=165716 RepID=A0A7J0HFP8_9ERIC|nr:hypothetical protein Acr_29g0011220 [Actinidia rufa]
MAAALVAQPPTILCFSGGWCSVSISPRRNCGIHSPEWRLQRILCGLLLMENLKLRSNTITGNQTDGVGAEVLSLLGSVYGSGEDKDVDGAIENSPESKAVFGLRIWNLNGKDKSVGKHPNPPKEKVEQLFLEPPSDLERLVDMIVEIMMRKVFIPYSFLALESPAKSSRGALLHSRSNGKSFISETVGSVVNELERKMILEPQDLLDPPYKANQPQFGVNVDAAAAAVILQAATRGIKNPNFGILSSTSLNGDKSEQKGHHNGLSQLPRLLQRLQLSKLQMKRTPLMRLLASTQVLLKKRF